MKKYMNKYTKRLHFVVYLFAVLLLLVLFTTKIVNSLFARYSSSDDSLDDGRVATYYVGSSLNTFNIEMPYTTSELVYEFNIVNFNGDKITETAYNYSFSVDTYNTLPLDISIEYKNSLDIDDYATISGLTANNGTMLCDTKTTHEYIIKIKWNESVIDYETTKEVDSLLINVHCEQIS